MADFDRAAAVRCGTVSFDSGAALDASRDAAAVRQNAVSEAGVEILDVAGDLVLAHLWVPQLV